MQMDYFALVLNMYLSVMFIVCWLRKDTAMLFCVWLITLTLYIIEELQCYTCWHFALVV